MKKYLMTLISIILVLILVLSPIKADAAIDDISVTLSSETKTIKAGDEVTVVFTVTDTQKINGFEADLKDNDILKIQSVKIDQNDDIFHNWSTTNNKLEISGNIANETLRVIITLKVVSNPTSKVSFTVDNIQVNEDNTNWTEESVRVGSKSIEFSPVAEQNPSGGGGEQGGDSDEDPAGGTQRPSGSEQDRDTDPAIVIGGNTSGGNHNSPSSSGTGSTGASDSDTGDSSNANTAKGRIPQAGENDILVIGMIVASMLAVAAYVGYRKYKCI